MERNALRRCRPQHVEMRETQIIKKNTGQVRTNHALMFLKIAEYLTGH